MSEARLRTHESWISAARAFWARSLRRAWATAAQMKTASSVPSTGTRGQSRPPISDAGRARPDRKKDAGRARPDRKKNARRARPDRKKDARRPLPDREDLAEDDLWLFLKPFSIRGGPVR